MPACRVRCRPWRAGGAHASAPGAAGPQRCAAPHAAAVGQAGGAAGAGGCARAHSRRRPAAWRGRACGSRGCAAAAAARGGAPAPCSSTRRRAGRSARSSTHSRGSTASGDQRAPWWPWRACCGQDGGGAWRSRASRGPCGCRTRGSRGQRARGGHRAGGGAGGGSCSRASQHSHATQGGCGSRGGPACCPTAWPRRGPASRGHRGARSSRGAGRLRVRGHCSRWRAAAAAGAASSRRAARAHC